MMMEILNREAELVKMANENDTEIRQQEKEIEDKVNKKDSEKREFNWKLVGGISFALMTVVGISAGVLGGKLDLKLPMYRGELAISKIQYAKNESLCELKNQAERYPTALQKGLTEFFMFEAGFSLMFAENNIDKDDVSYVCGHCFRSISSLNQVLFAVNKEYCINEKKAVKMIEDFKIKPSDYKERVDKVISLISTDVECTRKGIEILQRLVNEVEHLKGADIQ